jgi:DNA modification methylase
MIEMWDSLFSQLNSSIRARLSEGNGNGAFELMHRELDRVWANLFVTLRKGGMACIVVGDAVRKVGNDFAMYSNQSRIVSGCLSAGFTLLPGIIWTKETNKPNKFMGSGMLPPSAYPTLEHEHIIVLRKGGSRIFGSQEEKLRRRSSAFFWEERNIWFSDQWTGIKGERQSAGDRSPRGRTASFPFEIAARLVNMFSIQGDNVLDPFLGLGTTSVAAAVCGRNSIGCEVETGLCSLASERFSGNVMARAGHASERLRAHTEYVGECLAAGKVFGHTSHVYSVPVTTSQETDMHLPVPASVRPEGENTYRISYED